MRFEKMKIEITTVIVLVLLLVACESPNTTGGGKSYEGKTIDEILITEKSDTLNIVFEYAQNFPDHRDTIPYSFLPIAGKNELVKFNLFVSYNSIKREPKINKEIIFSSDTVFIWYSYHEKLIENLPKSNFIVEMQNAPIVEYIFIDSINIECMKHKTINLDLRNKLYK